MSLLTKLGHSNPMGKKGHIVVKFTLSSHLFENLQDVLKVKKARFPVNMRLLGARVCQKGTANMIGTNPIRKFGCL